MNFRKNQNSSTPGFQMAPMLDIVFILLIHFMAATLYAKWENKLEINVPTASAQAKPSGHRREIIINVDKEGGVTINSTTISLERLDHIFASLRAQNPNQPVIIRADQDTRHKDVIRILDFCAKNDIRNVAFSTIKPSAPEEKAVPEAP